MFETQKELASKTLYAAVGAPMVAARRLHGYGSKLAEVGTRIADEAQGRFDEAAKEGERLTKQVRERNVVEELQSKVDLDRVQDRVEKLRDQLEGALASWRESFAASEAAAPVKDEKPAAKKPAPKKTAAKKAPAARKPAAKPAAKKPATKASTTKKPAAKKAPAKKAPARKAPARKAPAKATTAKKTAAKN
ncbi:MAG: hypothetical protein ACE5GC_06510 [Acidimicrobiia bacterium]